MAKHLALGLDKNMVPECWGDIFILLIDHDTTSIVSLTSMLTKFSYKVMSVNVASEALSFIEKHNEIGLIIANIEMPLMDPQSFLTSLLHKDIPLMLISPENKTEQQSDLLMEKGCFCLKKPYSEEDIKNILQQILHKKSSTSEKINIPRTEENVADDHKTQIQAFRDSLKKQGTCQAALLGRRPISENFKTSGMCHKRKISPNAERNNNLVDSNVGEPKNLWTYERHMKFLAALSVLGVENPCPSSILEIMNETLTYPEVYDYLQKYKAQVEQISDTRLRKNWRSRNKIFKYPSNYEYPFKASNLRENVIASNLILYPLRIKNSPSSYSDSKSSVKNYSVVEKNEEKPKFYLGGVFDLENHPFLNESSKDIDFVSSAASNNPTCNMDDHNLSGNNFNSLSNRDRFQMGHIGHSSSTLETNRNQIDLGSTSTLDANVPQVGLSHLGESYNVHPNYTMNTFETNMAHMDWVSSTESYNPSQNMMSSVTEEDFVHRETNHAVMNTENNINQMGIGSFGESYVLPRNILYYEFILTHMRLVTHQIGYRFSYETNRTILETNVNQMDWVSLQERIVHVLSPENVTSAGINTTQVGLVPAEPTQATPDNEIVPDINMEDASLVPYNTDHEVWVENLISFEKEINEMDMQSCLGNLSRGSAFNHPIPRVTTEAQDHSSAMELGSTSQQRTNNIEDMQQGQNFENDRELMDWINQLLNDA